MTKRILVLDDAASVRKQFKVALPSPLFEVVTPPSGEQMHEMLGDASHEYELVIVDVDLPGEDGYARAEQAHEMTQAPLVTMKHRHSPWDEARRKALSAVAHLDKPFIHDDVYQILKKLGIDPPSASEREAAGIQYYQEGWQV